MSVFDIIDEREFKRSAPSSHKQARYAHSSIVGTTEDIVSDEGADMKLCSFCGWCENPEHCVWSVQCPECCAPQMQHCTASDGRIVGLHQSRWDYASRDRG